MITVNDISIYVEQLFAAYPNARVSDETIGIYSKLLADIPFQHLEILIPQVILENPNFVPPAGKIKRRYIEMTSEEALTASEAWGNVVKQFYRVGHTGTPVFEDETTAAVVNRMNWRELCLSENQMADRAHFMKLYNEEVERRATRLTQTVASLALSTTARKGLLSIGALLLEEGEDE